MNQARPGSVSLGMHPLSLPTAALTALLLTGCASESSEQSAPRVPDSTGDGYVVKDYMFPPLTVAPGQRVRVADGDDEPHTLTAADGSFDTGPFDKSDPGTFTAPSKPGTYEVVCKIHPSMRGTLTVR